MSLAATNQQDTDFPPDTKKPALGGLSYPRALRRDDVPSRVEKHRLSVGSVYG